jgi:hypothetical protein
MAQNNQLNTTLKYLKEIAIVVFGVSISFFVDKCKSDKQDRETENLVYQNLSLDLKKDSMQLYTFYHETDTAYQKAVWLYDNIDSPEKLGDDLFNTVRGVSMSTIFTPINLTYEEIKQNGLSKLLKDKEIRRSIYDLYCNYYEDLRIVNEKVAITLEGEIMPFFHQNLPFSRNNQLDETQKKKLLQLFKNDHFKYLIRAAHHDKKMNVDYYKATYEKVCDVLERIRNRK